MILSRILVLGGAGAMARVAVHDLLESPGVEAVGLADLSLDRVKAEAGRYADDRVVPLAADARDENILRSAMKGWDAVINSTWYELNLPVMKAAIGSGVHYLDLGGLYHMTLKQLALDQSARDSGVTCILGLGSSPGVTNLMAALGASRLDSIDSVKIRVAGAALKRPSGGFAPPYSFRTILDEATMPAVILRQGEISEVPGLSVREEFSLPDPVGMVEGYFTLHSELATLPKTLGKGVRDMDFIVAFSPEFSKAVSLLVSLGLAGREPMPLSDGKVIPYEMLTKLVDSIPRPTEAAADFGIRRVELTGTRAGSPSHLVYDCASGPHSKWGIGGRPLGTGVPASLGAQWLARGDVKERGALPPELCIDPERFLHELGGQGRGIVTTEVDGMHRRAI